MKEQEINKARAVYYKVFSNFFVYTADMSRYFKLLELLELVKNNPLDESCSKAFENILSKIQKDSNVVLVQEYDDIFHNPQTTPIRTTASFYDEGVESGLKRVQMMQFLAKTRIRRDEKNFPEYEDSIGFVLTVLSELAALVSEGEEQYKSLQHCIFNEVLNEFVDGISKAIYEHEKADIYKDVITALLSFMEFERLYFDVSRVKTKQVVTKTANKAETISAEELERRAKNKALKAQGPKKQDDVFVASSNEEI